MEEFQVKRELYKSHHLSVGLYYEHLSNSSIEPQTSLRLLGEGLFTCSDDDVGDEDRFKLTQYQQDFVRKSALVIREYDQDDNRLQSISIASFSSLVPWLWFVLNGNPDVDVDTAVSNALGITKEEFGKVKKNWELYLIHIPPDELLERPSFLFIVLLLFDVKSLNSSLYINVLEVFGLFIKNQETAFFKQGVALQKLVPPELWLRWWGDLDQTEKDRYIYSPELLFPYSLDKASWPGPLERIRKNPSTELVSNVSSELDKVLVPPSLTNAGIEMGLNSDWVYDFVATRSAVSNAFVSQFTDGKDITAESVMDFWIEMVDEHPQFASLLYWFPFLDSLQSVSSLDKSDHLKYTNLMTAHHFTTSMKEKMEADKFTSETFFQVIHAYMSGYLSSRNNTDADGRTVFSEALGVFYSACVKALGNDVTKHADTNFSVPLNRFHRKFLKGKPKSFYQQYPLFVCSDFVSYLSAADIGKAVDSLSICLLISESASKNLRNDLMTDRVLPLWEAWAKKHQKLLKSDSDTRRLFLSFWQLRPIPECLHSYVFSKGDLVPRYTIGTELQPVFTDVTPRDVRKQPLPTISNLPAKKDNEKIAVTLPEGIEADDVKAYEFVWYELDKRGNEKAQGKSQSDTPEIGYESTMIGCTLKVRLQFDPVAYEKEYTDWIVLPLTFAKPRKSPAAPVSTPRKNTSNGNGGREPKKPKGFDFDALDKARAAAEEEAKVKQALAEQQREQELKDEADNLWSTESEKTARTQIAEACFYFSQINHQAGNPKLGGSFVRLGSREDFAWNFALETQTQGFKDLIEPVKNHARTLGFELVDFGKKLPIKGCYRYKGERYEFVFGDDLKPVYVGQVPENKYVRRRIRRVFGQICEGVLTQSFRASPALIVPEYEALVNPHNTEEDEAKETSRERQLRDVSSSLEKGKAIFLTVGENDNEFYRQKPDQSVAEFRRQMNERSEAFEQFLDKTFVVYRRSKLDFRLDASVEANPDLYARVRTELQSPQTRKYLWRRILKTIKLELNSRMDVSVDGNQKDKKEMPNEVLNPMLRAASKLNILPPKEVEIKDENGEVKTLTKPAGLEELLLWLWVEAEEDNKRSGVPSDLDEKFPRFLDVFIDECYASDISITTVREVRLPLRQVLFFEN